MCVCVYKTQQQEGGGCASPAVLGWLVGMALLLLPLPWKPSTLLGLQCLGKLPSTTTRPRAACQCLWHSHKAAACHATKAVGQVEGLFLSPHLRHLLQSGCGFSIHRRNRLSPGDGNKHLRPPTPIESTDGTEGGGWCGIGTSFLYPFSLNSSKATFMGACPPPHPMRILLNKGSRLGCFNAFVLWGCVRVCTLWSTFIR